MALEVFLMAENLPIGLGRFFLDKIGGLSCSSQYTIYSLPTTFVRFFGYAKVKA